MPDGPMPGQRVTLRRWISSDLDAFADLNGDANVMATIGPVMDRAESAAFMQRISRHFADHGFGLWCVEVSGGQSGSVASWCPGFEKASRSAGVCGQRGGGTDMRARQHAKCWSIRSHQPRTALGLMR